MRHRDFIRVEDCYFSVIGYCHDEAVRCLLRYVPSDEGDRVDARGRRYKKLGHEEALKYRRFGRYVERGLFKIPRDIVDEVFKPEERLEEVCERDEYVAIVRDYLRLPKMGVTGSRLIGLSKPDSDVDFVAYGRSFEIGRRRIREGFLSGELRRPRLREVYLKRKVVIPYEVFRIHEGRKFNRARIGDVEFDLLYVRDERKGVAPDVIGRKMGKAVVRGEVVDDRFVFDYPAYYPIDHDEVKAVLCYAHAYTGQVFKGEVLEAFGTLEVIEGELYLIVGSRRESGEYLVSLTLIEEKGMAEEFNKWRKFKGFEPNS